MRNTRIAGHGLQMEGRALRKAGQWDSASVIVQGTPYCRADGPAGIAVCQCGEVSGALLSDAARKRWHAEHKRIEEEQVRRSLAADRADPHDAPGRTDQDDWLKD